MPPVVNITYPSDGVGLIAFADPPMNFGTAELGAKILEAIEAAQEEGCRVIVLASDTEGYFIAHWSLQQIVDGQTAVRTAGSGMPRRGIGVFEGIGASPVISIAANNGQAWGGGAELSWACDLRIAAESATYGQPEVALGIIPGAGGTTRLARLIGPTKCMEMILDGRPISARQALELGAINKVVPDDRLRDEAIAWAVHIAQWPAWALDACKRSLVEGRDLPLPAARRNESLIFGSAARREGALEIMRAAQAKYDAGADSYEAIGLERQ
ncbi:MAG: enoyl-CoA hydratase/isomerase family protein [Dehalococcoidia bacterium]